MATLHEWEGGTAAFARLINAFYDRVEFDDLLAPFFPGGVSEEHRDQVIAWWSEVFGGPAHYTEELGGYEHGELSTRCRVIEHAPGPRWGWGEAPPYQP